MIELLKSLMELRQDQELWEILAELAGTDWSVTQNARVNRLCGFFERDMELNPDGIQQQAVQAVLARAAL